MKIVCFGEIMLRLSPPNYERFVQANKFNVVYGGGEANVSVSLANYNLPVSFVTKLPDNLIGQAALNDLRKFGVDTSFIPRGGKRLGIYYLEKGFSQRPSKVVYDRAYSSVSESRVEDFDFDKIFEGATWFHFTGISPALGNNVAEVVKKACKTAKKLGVKISCDLNYRKNLWSREEAQNCMTELMEYVDVVIANEEDADMVFGIKADKSDIEKGVLEHSAYEDVAKKLKDKFNFEKVAITLRTSISACDNNWAALLYNGDEFYLSKEYKMHIVDRVGGGDSFGAGLIYGILNGFSDKDTIEYAAAASCLKHSIEGDYNQVSVDEVKALMAGDSTGRVKR
ncbi:MAG: sugar kinase [Clostridiales bacterium]